MLYIILLDAGLAAGCLFAGKILIHYFQLESYQFHGYFRTLKRNLLKSCIPGILMALALGLMLIPAYLMGNVFSPLYYIAVSVLLVAAGFLIGKKHSEKKAKKALVYTSRIKRLYVISMIVFAGVFFLVLQSVISHHEPYELLFPACLCTILIPLFLPLWIALGGLLAWPVEKMISELYFRDAQKILKKRNDLIRIGITGSWGKTSVKFILGTILEEKYHTLVTPASFNTPMGVTKVIRSGLEPGHRVFVSEMGARHVGDIKEMCRLVHPQIGIITSVGPQHLDTFRTVERVVKTKYELIEALPMDGMSFFADDGDLCREMFNRTTIEKTLTGLDHDADQVWAENIQFTNNGSTFTLCTASMRQPCSTMLLGELNVRNIVLSAAVCLKLGMTGEQIARGIARIRPVEHRLQLIHNPGGLTVIDDAFNSNIRGAEQAFRVLKEMNGTRILVTPGMVELGEQEETMNRALGKAAADCCDLAILVGKKRSAAILEGLRDKQFPEDKIMIVSSLEEAAELLKTKAGKDDTILFENDLPDNYSE